MIAKEWRPARRDPAGRHCEICGRIFAAGHVPWTTPLICRDCRDEAHPKPPALNIH